MTTLSGSAIFWIIGFVATFQHGLSGRDFLQTKNPLKWKQTALYYFAF